VFLFKLRAIAARDHSADSKLDPVFVFFRLLFGSRGCKRLAIAGARPQPDGSKTSRKNHYQEYARQVGHKTEINI
jgi:hypothetical protein